MELCEQIQSGLSNKVAFVRADHYFNLYNQAHNLPFNLCLSQELTVRNNRGTREAERVLDGTPTTVWNSQGSSSLDFDLGKSRRIGRYVVLYAGAGGLNRQLNTRRFSLAASSDRASWEVIDQRANNTNDVTDVNLKGPQARYLRLTIEDSGDDSIACIADVEIYGH